MFVKKQMKGFFISHRFVSLGVSFMNTCVSEIMRDHQSHDILLFCIDCHQAGNMHDLALRHRLAEMCDAPIGTEEDVKVREDFALKKVRSAGRALLNNKGHKIPEARLRELTQILEDYYETTIVTKDIMLRGANLETK